LGIPGAADKNWRSGNVCVAADVTYHEEVLRRESST
jgi:hypothetical protein